MEQVIDAVEVVQPDQLDIPAALVRISEDGKTYDGTEVVRVQGEAEVGGTQEEVTTVQ